jgi:hypothetical protein
VTGWVRVEKQTMGGNDQQRGHRYVCDRSTVQCRGEEGEPWDGRDQIIVLLVAVSCRRSFQDLLKVKPSTEKMA